MASKSSNISFTIENDIKIKLPDVTKEFVEKELEKATTEELSKDFKVDLEKLKNQAQIFLSSIVALDTNYANFSQNNLNKILTSAPEAVGYLNGFQMNKERIYTQSLYMLAFRFDEFLSRFRKEDKDRKVLYVFDVLQKDGTTKTETYEMNYRELVLNSDKHGRINEISKKRLTFNERQALENSNGFFPEEHVMGAEYIYNIMKNRMNRYFETCKSNAKGGGKQNAIVMWKNGKDWMLGNVLNEGDLKEAYVNFLFNGHKNNLCKLVDNKQIISKKDFGEHEAVNIFYNNYLAKVTNLPAIVEEDILTTDKQYGVKGKKASLPSLQQYIDAASAILRGDITEKNIENEIKNLYKKEVSRNIAKKLGKCEQKLTELTAKELKELFDNINI